MFSGCKFERIKLIESVVRYIEERDWEKLKTTDQPTTMKSVKMYEYLLYPLDVLVTAVIFFGDFVSLETLYPLQYLMV